MNRIRFSNENILLHELKGLYENKSNWVMLPSLTRLYVFSIKNTEGRFMGLTEEDKSFFHQYPELGISLWRIIQIEKIQHTKLETYVIEILIYIKKISLLAGIVQSVHNNLSLVIKNDLPSYLTLFKSELTGVAKEKIQLSTDNEKVEAAHLLAAMLKLGLAGNITPTEIIKYFPNTRYLQLKSWVVEIWGACNFTNESELKEIISHLQVFFNGEKDFIIAKSHYSYLQLICKAEFDCSFLRDQILKICFSDIQADKTGQKFKFLNRLIINQTSNFF